MRARFWNLSKTLLPFAIAGCCLWGCDKSSGTSPGSGGATSSGGTTSASGGSLGKGGNGAGGSNGYGESPGSGGGFGAGGAASGGARASGGAQGSGGLAPGSGGNNAGGGGTGGAGGASTANGGSNVDSGSHDAATGGAGGSTASDGGSSGAGGTVTCPSPALKSGDSTKKITVGTLSREYILHVPSAYTGSAPAPLVVDFHPIGGSDTSWRSGSPYPAVIDKEGVISAFPNGEPSPNMGNAWDVEGCCNTADDVAFARALVADIEKVACIDVKRVYAVGFSMGGGMSNYLACQAADVFAAVGPASFDLTQQNEGNCKPVRPITVIEWRGKNDNVVPYAGGHSALVTGMAIDFLGAVGTFQKWASLDGCTGNPSAADSNNCQTYSPCSAGVQVTLCTDNNGGHEAANASVVWPMLKKYTLP